jgi:NitT/TauT family transport system ATP-binding protein
VPELEVSHLAKTYGVGPRAIEAIRDLTFTVEPGEFVSIVGPSGAGKTTLLKCLSGLLAPTGGSASVAGRPIDGPIDALALVFQNYSVTLLPWMSVEANVMLPLLAKKELKKSERVRRAHDALHAVGLDGFLKSYPWQLSGGMQQRVSIARGLAYEPRVLLMDEPFASVDAQTRADLEDLVLEVHANFEITVVFVTHDIDESIYLADRVVVMTHRPATVKEIVTVDLPRPRDQVETKSMPEFAAKRAHVFRLIQREREDAGAELEPVAASA